MFIKYKIGFNNTYTVEIDYNKDKYLITNLSLKIQMIVEEKKIYILKNTETMYNSNYKVNLKKCDLIYKLLFIIFYKIIF